jgi:hypothetical protein
VQESLVVVGVLAAYALLGLLPWDWLFGGGVLLVVLGMLIGVPASIWYHLRLYRSLKPRALLDRGWWLRPYRLHDRLLDSERGPVMWWFRFGAVWFVLAVLGCVMVGVGAWRGE